MSMFDLTELVHLIHGHGPTSQLKECLADPGVYRSHAPFGYNTQAEIAFIGLISRDLQHGDATVTDAAQVTCLRTIAVAPSAAWLQQLSYYEPPKLAKLPQDPSLRRQCVPLLRRLVDQVPRILPSSPRVRTRGVLAQWIKALEGEVAGPVPTPPRRPRRPRGERAPGGKR